jgi:hypothetical protein
MPEASSRYPGEASGVLTLTATSADEDCRRRWIVRVIFGAECIAQTIDGLALETESDVSADICCDAGMGEAEEVLDRGEVGSKPSSQR